MKSTCFCLLACLPAVRPTTGGRIGPVFSYNAGCQLANIDLLIQLQFIHCTIVSLLSFIASLSLWLVNEKVRNHWRGVDELNSLYLLRHANGLMHMYLIAPSIKIITKHNIFPVYWFKSARMVSCWDLYACSWAVIWQYSCCKNCYQAGMEIDWIGW